MSKGFWSNLYGNKVTASIADIATGTGSAPNVAFAANNNFPLVPTSVAATTKSMNVVQVSWVLPVGGCDGIEIVRSVTGVAGTTTINVASPATTWDDTCGNEKTTSYTLRSYRTGLYSVTSASANGSTYCGAPGTITMDAGYPTNHTTAAFTWTLVADGSPGTPPSSAFWAIYLDGTLQTTVAIGTLTSSVNIAPYTDSAHTLMVRMESTYLSTNATGPSNSRTLTLGHAQYNGAANTQLGGGYVQMWRNVVAGPDVQLIAGTIAVTITNLIAYPLQNEGFTSSLFAGTATRKCQRVFAGVGQGDAGSLTNAFYENLAVSSNATGVWGYQIYGTGWNTAPTAFWADGNIFVWGYYTYGAVNNS